MTGQPATTAAQRKRRVRAGRGVGLAKGQEATTANDGQVFVTTVQ